MYADLVSLTLCEDYVPSSLDHSSRRVSGGLGELQRSGESQGVGVEGREEAGVDVVGATMPLLAPRWRSLSSSGVIFC